MKARAEARHDDGGGHALARDVGDRERHVGVLQRKEVEIVAGELERRVVPSRDGEAPDLSRLERREELLDGPGDAELAFDLAFLLLLFVEAGALDRHAGLRRERLEEPEVFGSVRVELVALQVEKTDDLAAAEHRGDDLRLALLSRVHVARVLRRIGTDDARLVPGRPSRETFAELEEELFLAARFVPSVDLAHQELALAVDHEDRRSVVGDELLEARQDLLENGFEIERFAERDAQFVEERALELFALRLAEEPRVLEGRSDVVAESEEDIEVLLRKRRLPLLVDRFENADEAVPAFERNAQDRLRIEPELLVENRRVPRVVADVVDDRGAFVLGDPADDPETDGDLEPRRFFPSFPWATSKTMCLLSLSYVTIATVSTFERVLNDLHDERYDALEIQRGVQEPGGFRQELELSDLLGQDVVRHSRRFRERLPLGHVFLPVRICRCGFRGGLDPASDWVVDPAEPLRQAGCGSREPTPRGAPRGSSP